MKRNGKAGVGVDQTDYGSCRADIRLSDVKVKQKKAILSAFLSGKDLYVCVLTCRAVSRNVIVRRSITDFCCLFCYNLREDVLKGNCG